MDVASRVVASQDPILDMQLGDCRRGHGELVLELLDTRAQLPNLRASFRQLAFQILDLFVSRLRAIHLARPFLENCRVAVHRGATHASFSVEVLLDESPVRALRCPVKSLIVDAPIAVKRPVAG